MLLERVRNYGIVILLYVCSSYHFIFSFLAEYISQIFLARNLIVETVGIQEVRLRSETLLIYAFETFTLMTCFIIAKYIWKNRKHNDKNFGVREFLDAFLFSQIAYLGYIINLVVELHGIHAVNGGLLFWLLYVPMFCICYPLSRYLFKRRLKKLEAAIPNEDEKAADRRIIVDYAIVWVIALAAALFVYSGNC